MATSQLSSVLFTIIAREKHACASQVFRLNSGEKAKPPCAGSGPLMKFCSPSKLRAKKGSLKSLCTLTCLSENVILSDMQNDLFDCSMF